MNQKFLSQLRERIERFKKDEILPRLEKGKMISQDMSVLYFRSSAWRDLNEDIHGIYFDNPYQALNLFELDHQLKENKSLPKHFQVNSLNFHLNSLVAFRMMTREDVDLTIKSKNQLEKYSKWPGIQPYFKRRQIGMTIKVPYFQWFFEEQTGAY